MDRARIEKETDIERLRQIALVLESETRLLYRRVAELRSELAGARGKDKREQLELELQMLQERLAERDAELFGTSRSERRGRRGKGKDKKGRKKQTGHGPTPQPDVEHQTVEHTLDEADTICPACGDELHPKEGWYEESEEIGVVRRFYVLRHHRQQKYGCRGCGHLETAPGPVKLVKGGRYGLDFTIQVALDKHVLCPAAHKTCLSTATWAANSSV